MRYHHTGRAREQFENAPSEIQRAFQKQARLLIRDLRHPSLHAKKYDETNDVRQAWVTRGWRFYFMIQGDIYMILSIIKHPK